MQAGVGSQQGTANRWGDYSAMSYDARDGCTFWYTTQYIPVSGQFTWGTRVAAFRFPPANCSAPAQGTLSGTVTDTSGNPVPGALVQLDNGFSGATNASGVYSIVLPPGGDERARVGAAAAGMQPLAVVVPVTVNNAATTTQNFVLGGGAMFFAGPIVLDDSTGNNNGHVNKDECIFVDIPDRRSRLHRGDGHLRRPLHDDDGRDRHAGVLHVSERGAGSARRQRHSLQAGDFVSPRVRNADQPDPDRLELGRGRNRFHFDSHLRYADREHRRRDRDRPDADAACLPQWQDLVVRNDQDLPGNERQRRSALRQLHLHEHQRHIALRDRRRHSQLRRRHADLHRGVPRLLQPGKRLHQLPRGSRPVSRERRRGRVLVRRRGGRHVRRRRQRDHSRTPAVRPTRSRSPASTTRRPVRAAPAPSARRSPSPRPRSRRRPPAWHTTRT